MKRFLLLVLALVAGGCGREPAVRPPHPAPDASTGAEATVRGITSQSFDLQGRPVWKLKAAGGQVAIDERRGSGKLNDIQGSLFRDGKEAGTLSAKTGSADTSTGIVRANGAAVFRSSLYGTEIHSDRMEWRSKRNLIVASGNVVVRRREFVLVEPGEVLADTAAKQVWVEAKEGRLRGARAFVPLVATGLAMAQAAPVTRFGTVTVDGYTEIHGNLADPNLVHVTCKGPAVHLSAPDDGVDFLASELTATIVPKTTGRGGLRSATASGGFRFKFVNVSSQGAGADARGVVSADGSARSADYVGETHTLTLTESVHIKVLRADTPEPGIQADSESAVAVFTPDGNDVVSLDLTDHGHGTLTMPPGRVATGIVTAHLDRSNPADSTAKLRGNPVHLVAPERGLDLTSREIDLSYTEVASVPSHQRLRTAHATGDLTFKVVGLETMVPPDAKGRSLRSVSGTADELDFSRATAKLVLTGNVDMTIMGDWFQSPGMHTRNDEAVIVLDPRTNKVLSFDLVNHDGKGVASGVLKKESTKK